MDFDPLDDYVWIRDKFAAYQIETGGMSLAQRSSHTFTSECLARGPSCRGLLVFAAMTDLAILEALRGQLGVVGLAYTAITGPVACWGQALTQGWLDGLVLSSFSCSSDAPLAVEYVFDGTQWCNRIETKALLATPSSFDRWVNLERATRSFLLRKAERQGTLTHAPGPGIAGLRQSPVAKGIFNRDGAFDLIPSSPGHIELKLSKGFPMKSFSLRPFLLHAVQATTPTAYDWLD